MILNLRDPRRLGLVVLAALAIAGAGLYRIQVVQEYSPGPGVVLTWGPGEGQILPTTSRDGSLFGVRCFCVDPGGGVHVADWERGRVLKFDLDRELVMVTDLGRKRAALDDMAFLPGGTILAVDNSRPEILAVPVEGPPSVVWNGRLPSPSVSLIESISADDSGAVYVSSSILTRGEYIRRLSTVNPRGGERVIAEVATGPSGEVRCTGIKGEIPRSPVSFFVSVRGGFYVTPESTGPAAVSIRRYDWDGKPTGEFTLEADNKAKSVTLVGDDRAGRLYTGLDLGKPSGEILVFDRSGRRLARIAAPYTGKSRSSSYARVDSHGRIYLLEAGEREAVVRQLVPHRRMLVIRR